MSVKICDVYHYQRMLTDYTVCGVRLDGYKIRHTFVPSKVTCKRCLKYLAKIVICPHCDKEIALKGGEE